MGVREETDEIMTRTASNQGKELDPTNPHTYQNPHSHEQTRNL